MNGIEKIQAIRAKCEELLAISAKRTQGEWIAGGRYDRDYIDTGDDAFCTMHISNAAFIAACAGPAEAGWRATIAAIDALQMIDENCDFEDFAALDAMLEIIKAWESIV